MNFTELDDEELTAVTNAERVVRFRYRNDDKAFTPPKIAEATGVKQTSTGTVLCHLRERDVLEDEGGYWAICNEQAIRDAF